MHTWRMQSVHVSPSNAGHSLLSPTGGECVSASLNAPPRKSMAAVTPTRLHSSSFLKHKACLGTQQDWGRLGD